MAEADRSRGRFRSFLLTVCAHFLANRRDWERARKRGGDQTVIPIDVADAEGRYALEMADGLTPERIFDRSWALTLLGRTLDRLAREYHEAGKAATFAVLRGMLAGDTESLADAMLGSLGHRIQSAAFEFVRWGPSAGLLLGLATLLALVRVPSESRGSASD